MLIDMHAHSKGISRCCQIDGKDMVQVVKSHGMDGIILTNHYDKWYVENDDAFSFARRYVEEFHYVKIHGFGVGIKVFFGIEVTMAKHNNIHMLIYGVDPKFVLKYPKIYDLTQEELYHLVHLNNGILVQAHPFRGGKSVLLDLAYLDGVEVNCHPLYDGTHLVELAKIAIDNKLLLTCGGDYHADTIRPKCGVYFKDDIIKMNDLMQELLTSKETKLCVQEVTGTKTVDYIYKK